MHPRTQVVVGKKSFNLVAHIGGKVLFTNHHLPDKPTPALP
jgi:hypothetical protein